MVFPSPSRPPQGHPVGSLHWGPLGLVSAEPKGDTHQGRQRAGRQSVGSCLPKL